MIGFLCSVLDTMMPTVPGLKGVGESNLASFLRLFLRESPLFIRAGLYASAFVFVVSPVLTIYLPLPSFLLTKKMREKHAQRASAHSLYMLRQSMFFLKMVAGMCWGQGPEVRKKMGLEALEGDPGSFRETPRREF
jgi:hypothetical protein